MKFKYKLGDKLKDRVSGFSGIVMVRAEYSTGCIHYGLLPTELKDGKIQGWEWLDQSRLVLQVVKAVTFKVDKTRLGGPVPSGPEY